MNGHAWLCGCEQCVEARRQVDAMEAILTRKERTELLARMAAEIAGGILTGEDCVWSDDARRNIAETAVDIARRILAAVEKP